MKRSKTSAARLGGVVVAVVLGIVGTVTPASAGAKSDSQSTTYSSSSRVLYKDTGWGP